MTMANKTQNIFLAPVVDGKNSKFIGLIFVDIFFFDVTRM